MRPAARQSLRRRLRAGLALMLLPLVLLAAGGYWLFSGTVRAFDTVIELQQEWRPAVDLERLLLRAAMPTHDYLIHGATQERDAFRKLDLAIEAAFRDALAQPAPGGQTRAGYQAAYQDWRAARAQAHRILALPYPVRDPQAVGEMEAFDALLERATRALEDLRRQVEAEIRAHHLGVKDTVRRVRWLIGLMFLAGLAITGAAGWFLARGIEDPIRDLVEGADRLGGGNLTHRVAVEGPAELGRLAERFNAMASELEGLVNRDALTGLYNRREFDRRLAAEFERARRYDGVLSLLMLDLDRFKAVNDRYGHPAGDQVLRQLAELLQANLRPSDLLARYGGEEFSVILPHTGREAALALAERLRAAVARYSFHLPEVGDLSLTVSIGAASYPRDARTPAALVQAADTALYQAKGAGRNRVMAAGG